MKRTTEPIILNVALYIRMMLYRDPYKLLLFEEEKNFNVIKHIHAKGIFLLRIRIHTTYTVVGNRLFYVSYFLSNFQFPS